MTDTEEACQMGISQDDRGLRPVITPEVTVSNGSEVNLKKAASEGVAAIQRIIADRDDLRQRAITHQRELGELSAINEDLRRRIALIQHHYLEFGTKIQAQLEHSGAFRQVKRERDCTNGASSDHDNLVALAQRLRPNTAT